MSKKKTNPDTDLDLELLAFSIRETTTTDEEFIDYTLLAGKILDRINRSDIAKDIRGLASSCQGATQIRQLVADRIETVLLPEKKNNEGS